MSLKTSGDLDRLNAAMRDPMNWYGSEWDGQDIRDLIAELRASRKVVEAARRLQVSLDANLGPTESRTPSALQLALAELSTGKRRSADPGNQLEKNFSELGTDASLRSESESGT